VTGLITVTLNTTDDATTGTTSVATAATPPGGCVSTVPVTCNVWDTPDTNGPAKPTSVRVSKIRVGVIATNDDGSDDPALTATRLPAPNVTATAAPTAAQRDRHARERTRVVVVIVVCPISWSAQTQNRTQDPNPHTPRTPTQTAPDIWRFGSGCEFGLIGLVVPGATQGPSESVGVEPTDPGAPVGERFYAHV
jgi:hypothetical protein